MTKVETDIGKELADLDGLITPEIGRVLYEHARLVPRGKRIVELGSYRGASTCWLAAGARDGEKEVSVLAVDAWSTDVNAWSRYIQSASLDEFIQQVSRYELFKHTSYWQGLTTEVAEKYAKMDGRAVSLLYIDADHSEEAATADFLAWQRHLCDGATVIFDDYRTPQNPGVEAAVKRLTDDGWFSDVKFLAGRLAVATLGVDAVNE